MYESGLPFYIMDGTVMVWLVDTDPNEWVQKIWNERVGWNLAVQTHCPANCFTQLKRL